MKELNRKALLYSVLGMSAVIVTAFITDMLAPQNTVGEGLRFFIPLITGILAGAAIFFRSKEESDIDFDDLDQD